ncbi:MAG TPA: site-specific integrase [Opitutaceae bacterium]|jgi:integrase|nr:site-specific integrase [Opitutaceae bacterium]
MTHENLFSVSRFKNRNGVFSWRVDGRLHGVRIRRNFKTKEEAAAEKSALELKAMQTTSGLQTITTFLVTNQVREAEALFRRVTGLSHPLSFYVEFALANYREPVTQKLLTEAVTEYVATKQHEHEQDLLSEPHLTRMKRDLKRLEKHFPGATVAELTGARLVGYFEARKAALKTYNNRRGIVSTFLKFALQRDWMTDNPLAKIPPRRIRRRRGGAVTFSAAQAKELMAFVEQHYPTAVPFFALCLFAGIRPCLRTGEILRLQPAHIKLDASMIRIDAEVSKVREPRNVTIQPNLAAWLRAYPLKKFPIIPTNLQHIREKVAQKFPLSHDVMRHTFISMFVAKFRSLGEAALQAGNSESIIRKHYLDLKNTEEAEEFFGIMPKLVDGSATEAVIFPMASPELRIAV